MRELTDSVVVVTGASSGIGRATAHAFAGHGAKVALAARSEQTLLEAASECQAAGADALAIPTDVTDADAVHDLARQTADRFGGIDVWVNNAGVMSYGHFEQMPDRAYRRVIETNLFGQINGARAVLPYFQQQASGGVLINVASLLGRMTSPTISAYVTSKFGIRAFSEALREALMETDGIDVCTILPESVDTPIFHHAGNYTGRAVKPIPPVVHPERVVKAILGCAQKPRSEVTVGRIGHLLTLGKAVLPGIYERLVPHVFARAAFRAGSAEPTSGNLFQPMPELNRVSGNWRWWRPPLPRRGATGGESAGDSVNSPVSRRRAR